MKLIFSSFLWVIYGNLFCQITVINESNLPVSAVKVYASKQILLAQSDKNGLVEWSKIENRKASDTIYFKHAGYDTKWILRHNINRNDTIVLSNKAQLLPEFNLTSEKTKQYQTINACYRSYQLNDDSLIYYTDGLVDYLTKTNKLKYQKMLKDHRTYTDSAYVNDIKQRSYMIIFALARVPPPLTEYLPEKYFKRNNLRLSYQNDGTIHILTKKNIKIGTIEKDSNFVTYSINDKISGTSRKAPKYEVHYLSFDITLVFKISENDSNFMKGNFDDLVYSKISRKYDFKRDTDKEFTRIENVEEIFVESVQYTNEVEIDKFNNRFGFPKESIYQTAFWEKCNCKFYTLPPFLF
ncbi:MAG: hypothetical protein E6Q37_00935 [Crocinitomicaceae bacterium]|nr:MAG: hypothetical protein E6Q37_00935 [Crocinitomicaceae bacterium]